MKGISSMATRHVVAELADAALGAGLSAVEFESVGGVDAERRVAAGERFDLVVLARAALERLARDGHVVPGSVRPLLVSPTAVAVPSWSDLAAESVEGDAFPDADGLRDALRGARRIGYSTGPSGTALVALVEEWGMTSELGDRLVQARPGIPVARALADGEVDLGFQQLSELVGQPGIRILGVLPPDCAIDTVFAGAIPPHADAGPARDVLEFFASERAAPIITRGSFRPR